VVQPSLRSWLVDLGVFGASTHPTPTNGEHPLTKKFFI